MTTIRFTCLCSLSCLLWASPSFAQPYESWIARYNGGFTNKDHRPVAMALDGSGNIYVAGSSQNSSNDYDYVVLKYAPGGKLLWAARYASTNAGNDKVNGFVLDNHGNALLTGTAGTVKFNSSGALGWTAPYAGSGIAVDTDGNVYVTGFSTVDFATAKLDPQGSNVWTSLYDYGGWTNISQLVAVDNVGNVYVAGWQDWKRYMPRGYDDYIYYAEPALLMYGPGGAPIWTNSVPGGSWGPGEDMRALLPDSSGNIYLAANITNWYEAGYLTVKINSTGQLLWEWSYAIPPGVTAATLDSTGNIYLTGHITADRCYGTFKLSAAGQQLWQASYCGQTPGLRNKATAIALDVATNVYVTGVSTNTGTVNDWVTVKYDNNGTQLWLKLYNGPANGDDGAAAIAVAPDGSVYVTGYSANTNGGTDITTIKYNQFQNIQKKSDGTVELQYFGPPGQTFAFQATTNLKDWDELGSAQAATNGIVQFTDTAAPSFPHRFYRYYLP